MQATGRYDVVIVGGGIMGAACAWFLTRTGGFDGRVCVIERDPSYATASTTLSNSCMRQQFSHPLNVRISQFAAAFVKDFRAQMGGDDRVPTLSIQAFGYMYLAAEPGMAEALRAAQAVQAALGAGTRILTPERIAQAYPFYALDDILLGSHNSVDEGYWDGGTVFDWFRRSAAERGVTFVKDTVVGFDVAQGAVTAVQTAGQGRIGCGWVVNASGTRAAQTASMAGIALPVEPRKRYTWVFTAERPLDRPLPLTVDPSGVHVRQDGPQTYMAGAKGLTDPAVEPDDFTMDHALWEDHVWPAIAARIPQFDALRVVTGWAGHYAYNTLDQNAIVGPHPEIGNFLFVNGFSGHGLQQAPAMGRGLAEWICFGDYRTLDLSDFHFERLAHGAVSPETAVI